MHQILKADAFRNVTDESEPKIDEWRLFNLLNCLKRNSPPIHTWLTEPFQVRCFGLVLSDGSSLNVSMNTKSVSDGGWSKEKKTEKSKKKSKGCKTGNVTMAMAQDGYASKCGLDGSQKSIEALFNRPNVGLKMVNQNRRFRSTGFKIPQRGLPHRRLVAKNETTSSAPIIQLFRCLPRTACLLYDAHFLYSPGTFQHSRCVSSNSSSFHCSLKQKTKNKLKF